MAKKKQNQKTRKKCRIIREFVETKFKEVQEDKVEKEDEEELEESEVLAEEFFDFDIGTRTAPVLPESNTLSTVEEIAETSREARTNDNPQADTSLYSDYSFSASYTRDMDYKNPEQKIEILRPVGMDDKRIREMLPTQTHGQGSRMPEQIAWVRHDAWNIERGEERKYESLEKKAKEDEKLRIERRRRLKL